MGLRRSASHFISISFCEDFRDDGLVALAHLTELRFLRLKKGSQFTYVCHLFNGFVCPAG
jgi:hypothetical protein